MFFGRRYLAGEWQPCGVGVVLLFQACFNDGQIIWEEIHPPKFSPKYFRWTWKINLNDYYKNQYIQKWLAVQIMKLHISSHRFLAGSYLIYKAVITHVSLHWEKITISNIYSFIYTRIFFNHHIFHYLNMYN